MRIDPGHERSARYDKPVTSAENNNRNNGNMSSAEEPENKWGGEINPKDDMIE